MDNYDDEQRMDNYDMEDEEEVHTLTSYSCIMAPNRCTKRFLNISDSIISLCIVTPLVVGHWYGTWELMNQYEEYFPPVPTLLFGMCYHLLMVLTRHHVHEKVKTQRKKTSVQKAVRYLFNKIYIYVFSICCIMVFRAIFILCEPYDVAFVPAISVMCVCAAALVCLKCVRNLVAPPVMIAIDSKNVSFAFPTRFKTHFASKEPLFYFIDCAFSVIVVGNLVIFVWRSLWVLFDLIIFPNDPTLSGWYSLAIGYGIVAVTFALQPVMKWTCDRLTGVSRIAVCDAFLFFSFVGTVNVWRGEWELLDLHFLPDNKLLSNLITHGASFILLAMLNCSNSVLVRGVFIDAEEPAGQCVVFPVHYIRLFFQKERQKKEQRILDAIEKGELKEELLTKSEKMKPQIMKSSIKSVEMTNMVNNRPKIENGLEKEHYRNGDHKINQL